jgi:pilus assembly protein Flp/PilA
MISLRRLLHDEQGATAIEYALIVSLIFLAIVFSVSLVATKTTNMWTNISNHVK